MHYANVNIRRDATQVSAALKPVTEIPVLRVIHGGESVHVGRIEEHTDERIEELAPDAEYDRLVSIYGQEAVLQAYGGQDQAELKINNIRDAAARKAEEPVPETTEVSANEKSLLENFRDLSPAQQNAILTAAQNAGANLTAPTDLDNDLERALTDEGGEEIAEPAVKKAAVKKAASK